MKTMKKMILCVALVAFVLISCKDGDPSPNGGTTEVGAYAGFMQVSDDPQTQLGYIYNTTVSGSITGTNATVKITGDNGFDREYTGTVVVLPNTGFDITLKNQTKPASKIVSGRVIIQNNELAMNIAIASDNVSVIKYNTTETIQISGKLNIIGTQLLKK